MSHGWGYISRHLWEPVAGKDKTCDAGVWDAITYLDFINISESAPDTFLWPKKYPKMPRVWVQRTESGAD